MKRLPPLIAATLALAACTLFLWMFFAAAALERTADLGGISAPPGRDARAVAYEFAAKWRHGMAGNSPLYMPGFFAAAVAIWFWCAGKSLPRILGEGFVLVSAASLFAAALAPVATPHILKGFVEQEGVAVSYSTSSWTWVASAQGVYSLLTWGTFIIALRLSVKLRTPRPLLVPLILNVVLALVRPWTVADFTSLWVHQALNGESTAVLSFLLVPAAAGFIAWAELRSSRKGFSLSKSTSQRSLPK